MVGAFNECERTAKIRANLRSGFTFGDPKPSSPPLPRAARAAESYGVKRAQTMMGLKFRDNRIPTAEEFAEAAKANHLGAIRFTPAG